MSPKVSPFLAADLEGRSLIPIHGLKGLLLAKILEAQSVRCNPPTRHFREGEGVLPITQGLTGLGAALEVSHCC